MKIAVIGAGSYTFGHSMLRQVILDHKLDAELALMDLDKEIVELMARVGQRMASQTGAKTKVTPHTSRETALSGADYVVCCASPQIHKRFSMDCEIVKKHSPDHLITEFGGIAGISYSLRQIALIEGLAADMKKFCPNAMLLNVSNPLPRVVQAAHESGVKTAGFCTVSACAYGTLWKMFKNEPMPFPWTAAIQEWDLLMGGTNHFSWFVSFKERSTGKDLMPEFLKKLRSGVSTGNPRAEKFALETGSYLWPHDEHTKDFLPPLPGEGSRQEISHGNAQDRAKRIANLNAIADGKETWDELVKHTSWERPIDLVAADLNGTSVKFHSVNLPNTENQVPGLPSHVYVETPVEVKGGELKPQKVVLPEAVLPMVKLCAEVTDTIVKATKQRSKKLLAKAVELDPTIVDKAAGIRAVEECVVAHADVLPKYS